MRSIIVLAAIALAVGVLAEDAGMGFGGAPLAGVAGKFIRRHSGLYRSRVFPRSIL
jgi:hypothetical protein